MRNEELNLNKTSPAPANEGGKLLAGGLAFALVLVLIIGTIVVSRNHKQRVLDAGILESQKLEMVTQLSQRDSIINEWVVAFNEIESDIKKITVRENMLNMQSMNPEISQNKKEEILKEIKLIKEMIDQNKKKLTSLNSQLRNSGIKIASLENQIDTLNSHIAKSEKYMAELRVELVDRNFEIGQLNEKVTSMEVAMTDSSSKISQQTAEMNKAYVVSGTYKDLKEKGLLVKEGGVLGLGKKESLQENFENDKLFTRIDITKTRTIQVNSKTAKLVTEHPANSYELVKDDADKIAFIEITDPENFWKISKYAVVEVKN
jgi:chromosome segregation ATPase